MEKITTMTRLLKLKPLPQNSHTVVVGAGISGLSFAYFLGILRPESKITILEKSSRVGGYINSCYSEEHKTVLEKGPRTLRGVSTGTLLITDILHRTGNLDVVNGVHLNSQANKKYILAKHDSGNQLITVPGPAEKMSTFMNFFKSSPGRQTIKGIFKDLTNFGKPDVYNPQRDLSVEEFFTKHFGKGMITEVGSAIMYGVYAADVKDLSVRAVMPRMAEIGEESGSLIRHAIRSALRSKKSTKIQTLEREVEKNDDALAVQPLDDDVKQYVSRFGSKLNMSNLKQLLSNFPMLAFTGGLETLAKVLKSNMPSNVEFVFNDGVSRVTKKGDKLQVSTNSGHELVCDHLRSTVNGQELSSSFANAELSSILGQFQYSSVSVVNVFIKKDVKPERGFGFLVPKALFDPQKRLMGVIFDSDIESCAKPVFNSRNTDLVTSAKHETKKDITRLALDVHESKREEFRDYTKVTFMFNIDSATGEHASASKLRQIVAETFETHFGAELQKTEWFVETEHWDRSIPLYDVEYLARKRATMQLLGSEFSGKVSLGGMSFARGVGVPDCVLTAFQDAAELCEAESKSS